MEIKFGFKIKRRVASKINQGTMLIKTSSLVLINKKAPRIAAEDVMRIKVDRYLMSNSL